MPTVEMSADQQAALSRVAGDANVAAQAKVMMSGGAVHVAPDPAPPGNAPAHQVKPGIKGFDFQLPKITVKIPQLPTQLGPFNTNYIAFSNGVPVGGHAQLTISNDGGYNFTGSFHDSGFPSYDLVFGWGILSKSGVLFTFSQTGHMSGTYELSGSRDFNWTSTGTNPEIKAGWADLCASYSEHWSAAVNFSWPALETAIQQAIAVGQVVAKVVQVLA